VEALNQEDKQRIILQHRIGLLHFKPLAGSKMTIGLAIIGLISAFATAIIIWPHYCVRLISSRSNRITWMGSGDRNYVALTIDDGPDPVYTPQILDILATKGIKATFFVVGDRALRYPDIIKRICAEGHQIGNHTGSWKRTIFLGQRQFENDLDATSVGLGSLPCATKFFRPAGIWIRSKQLQAVRDRGYRCVLGSAYAYDPARPPSRYIAWAIGRGLRPGAIAVIHDSGGDRSATAAALPGIIVAAKRKNLKFVLLSELLDQ